MTGRSGGSGQRTRRERPSNGRRTRDRSWADDSQGLHFPLEELARLAERRQTDDRHFELERQDEGLVMLCMLVEEKAGRRAPKTRKRKPNDNTKPSNGEDFGLRVSVFRVSRLSLLSRLSLSLSLSLS